MRPSAQTVLISLPALIALSFCSSVNKGMQPPAAFCECRGIQQREISKENAERFGFFSSKLYKNYRENLKNEINIFGVTPAYALWYIDVGSSFPMDVCRANDGFHMKTVINHDIRSHRFTLNRNERMLADIARGEFDGYFRTFAREAAKFRRILYYRFGYEMNGDWFAWGEQPENFKKAWRRVHLIFHQEGAHNVEWIFSPGVLWQNRTFKDDILVYYPGDDVVDIVGLDGYNFGDHHSEYHRWESFEQVFAKSLVGIARFNKPIWIAEVGCAADARRSEWMKNFFRFIDRNPCIEVFIWFNDNKQHEPNFRLDADSATLEAFRQWVSEGSPGKKDDRKLVMR
ncbi:MAG: hypothetical protein GF398_20725 [Chitinivibrionales bacterium]|nr:hypothetical protein [Chitinivibrionales bacterium]